MSPFERNPKQDGDLLLLQKASLVANLSGWSGGILYQPWYQWLSPDDVLLRGGDSISEGFDHPRNGHDAGREGMLYRLPVRSGTDEKGLLARQRPVALPEMSRRIQAYGRFALGGAQISPNGRWLLYVGARPLEKGNGRRDSDGQEVRDEFYWCAVAVDGSRDVAWLIKIRSRNEIVYQGPRLSDARWLPDSSGILETDVDRDVFGRKADVITGQVRLLTSPTVVYPLPPVHLPKSGDNTPLSIRMSQIQMIAMPEGRTIALYQLNQDQDFDPNLTYSSGRDSRPPDRVVVYEWNWRWQSRISPSVRTRIITMPPGYHVFDQAISHTGDRIVWAVMDRAHHTVVSTGRPLHRRHGNGKIGLWVSGLSGGNAAGIREIGYMPVPFGQEAGCYQRFGVGGWLPGDKRISFQFGKTLYTAPVP